MGIVTVYSTSNCPWCVVTKDYLKGKGISYVEKKVDLDQTAASEMVRKSGQMGVPVIDINGEIIVGFDRQKLDSLLK